MSLSQRKRRARLSMTSLIDVIFLLLLFFMLSSTFSKFAQIELNVGSSGGPSGAAPPQETFFLRLAEDGITLNGQAMEITALAERLSSTPEAPSALIVSVTETAEAQGLADVLASVRTVPNLSLSVIGPS